MDDTKKADKPSNGAKGHDKQRRKAMDVVTKAGIGLAVTIWSKPIVQSVVMPAHAQTSPYDSASTDEGEFNVRLTERSRNDDDSRA